MIGQRCRDAGVRPSMGSVGDAYDNAICESFFATLECELLNHSRFATHDDARQALFTWIEGWYNSHRLHRALGYRPPQEFEKLSETYDSPEMLASVAKTNPRSLTIELLPGVSCQFRLASPTPGNRSLDERQIEPEAQPAAPASAQGSGAVKTDSENLASD